MCNFKIYTLVLWTRRFGLKTQEQLIAQGVDEIIFENQLYEIEHRNKEDGIEIDMYAEGKHGPQLYKNALKPSGFPLAYGEWNNWRPQRMYTIEEFCHLMDDDKPDIIGQLKKQKLVRKYCNDVSEMDEVERGYYNEKMYRLMKGYSE